MSQSTVERGRRALETHRTWNEMAKHAAVVEQAGIDI
jgi:hypothetical protein